MRRRWRDTEWWDAIAPPVTVPVLLLSGLIFAWGASSYEPCQKQAETAPSSVVGGMGMPGKAGSGMQWNREEGVQDEQ